MGRSEGRCVGAVISASLVLLMLVGVGGQPIAYNTSSGVVMGKLNAHLVLHTHDDVGWLKTVDQYYVGSNNSIQGVSVQLILDTVISELQEDPNRKFVYVEMAFFYRWWRRQSPIKQAIVKKLVDSGQLEFINGGWCMHDEAATHYIDMIDQTTLGHHFIKRNFDKTPRTGWQIDPFGHSAVQAYLLGAEVGFDSLYFARIDYQDRATRKNDTSLEMVWRGSKSLGSTSQIFTGAFLVHYSPPTGFKFETGEDTIPIQDDPLLFDYNVKDRVNAFVETALEQAQYFRTNNIMFTMGDDFTYQNAHSWYKELDKFIHYVNMDGRVNAFYSTPSIYTDAKYEANETWPLKTDDFFPYADRSNAYWTGYFTSRPTFKGYVRMLSGYNLAAKQLEFLVKRKKNGPNTDALSDALAISQHHDGVSGTEKQHVADDYARRLAIGSAQAMSVINSALSCLTSPKSNLTCEDSPHAFQQSLLINISYCPPSETYPSAQKDLVVIAYNSLGWNRSEYVRIPVNAGLVAVRDTHGKIVSSQLVPISNATERIRKFYVQANLGVSPGSTPKYCLVFKVDVPPFGFSSYFITDTSSVPATVSSIESPTGNGSVVIGSGNLKLTFSLETGQLIRITDIQEKVDLPLQQSYLWYGAYDGTDGQASGAYIFRPDGAPPRPLATQVPLKIVRGPLVDEAHQQFSPWLHQVIRVYKDKDHAEFEFMIGPIPFNDGIGKELITRLTTSITSNGIFYTDSNGRDFIKRVRDQRTDWDLTVEQPISGNYYPLNLGMYLEDAESEISVLVDRAVGGSSILDGQLEIMLHRRLLYDDSRGVGEPLSETVCVGTTCEGLTVEGTYLVKANRLGEGSRWRRTAGQHQYSPLLLAFTTQNKGDNWQSSHPSTFTAVAPGYSLPHNVALINLQELDDGSVLLRLAHLYEVNENKELSTLTTVNLKSLFATSEILNATEVSLTANQERSAMRPPKKWRVSNDKNEEMEGRRGKPFDPSLLEVELAPMEIRTFLLHFKP